MDGLRGAGLGLTSAFSPFAAAREAMIARLMAGSPIHPDIVDAFRAVPRHLFSPGTPLEHVYGEQAVVTKRDQHGVAISAITEPRVQALMLAQAELRPGMRVLEIGSGGVNAALVAELVGERGEVTSVDIDREVVHRARTCLAYTGYAQVNVVHADAEQGVAARAPYDRVLVTAEAADIPPAWVDQLAEGGRLVVPLRMRGLTRSVALDRADGHLVSAGGYHRVACVPMQGIEVAGEDWVPLDESVRLRVDGRQPSGVDKLRAALAEPALTRWSGIEVGAGEPSDDLDLWLACTASGFCHLVAADPRRGFPEAARWGVPTAVAGATLAYRDIRPAGPRRFELGVRAHGPDAEYQADRYVELIRTWHREHRPGPSARIEVWPASTPTADLPDGHVVEKVHSRVVLGWPVSRR
ncbi:methyltransferase, FxLD system [Actinophytocola sp.]|uniref:methyltransferase, FxLD system n=1 Tax=Actinophytocola sp. TaxID=1872138 RepID=UPI002EDB806B